MTTTISTPGHPIESVVFNASNWAEDISLVSNEVLEVDYDMEPAPNNVTLVETPAAETMYDGHKWGWDGIDTRVMVAQNHNYSSFKNG